MKQNSGKQLFQDLFLPPVLASYTNKCDPLNTANHSINAQLTEMELQLPHALLTQHKQTHNEACMNGDLSVTEPIHPQAIYK